VTTTIDPWTSWLSSIDRDQLRYVASRFLAPLPLAPFRSVATDDDDRFSAARSRGSMLSRRESRRGASEGEGVESRSTKTTQHAAAWGLQASLEVESWSVVSKRSYLDIPIIFHLDTRRFIFISSFHHHQFDRSVFGYSG
jgi:hypothetical protein